MYIFRLHIKPGGSEDWDYSFRYCLKNNLLGIGWTIPNNNKEKIDWVTYQKKAIKKYSKIPQVKYFEKWVTKDCLIWVRNSSNEYYLAKVNSPWEYIDNEKARRADITNTVRVSFQKINNPDDVPGKVIASFRATRTIQEVSSENIFIYSKLLWNELSKTNHYKIVSKITNYFDFFTDDEAEDILYVYLQYKNYIVVPNTRKKDTLSYEYYLINKNNFKRAITQVKTGSSTINMDNYKNVKEKVFLLQTNDMYEGSQSSNINIITTKQISNFIGKHKNIVPKNILKWYEFLKE